MSAHKDEIRALAVGGWTPETIVSAIAITGITVQAELAEDGSVQVKMSVPQLCSLAEAMCGSMSEFDLDGCAEDQLTRWAQIARISRRHETE